MGLRKIPTPQTEMKGNIRRSTRLTPKTPQTEMNGNTNVMKRVAFKKGQKKSSINNGKARVSIVPKFQVTLIGGDRTTPQKASDILKVKKSPSNAIASAAKMVN